MKCIKAPMVAGLMFIRSLSTQKILSPEYGGDGKKLVAKMLLTHWSLSQHTLHLMAAVLPATIFRRNIEWCFHCFSWVKSLNYKRIFSWFIAFKMVNHLANGKRLQTTLPQIILRTNHVGLRLLQMVRYMLPTTQTETFTIFSSK